ncbi:toxin-activating lysine-acyltransferase [Magnetococcales bacterium HHB-1]
MAKDKKEDSQDENPENAPSEPDEKPQYPFNALLGQVTALMLNSPPHKHFFISDLEWLVVPPIALGQFRLFQKERKSIGYASWAYIDEAIEERLKGGSVRLRPDEWKSGDKLWLIDLVAPFGGHQDLIKDLKEQVFENQTMKTLQTAPDGQGMAVVEW